MKGLLSFIAASCLSFSVLAGSEAGGETKFAVEEITHFAKEVERYAAARGARAFIISRVGRDPEALPEGVEFTHTAVAIYSSVTTKTGEKVKGYAIHNLYQRAEDASRSDIIVDYPVDFFWGAHALKAGIVIPSPALQSRLVKLVAEGKHLALHNPNYSVLANPFNSQFQNCTEFTLDMINAAVYQTTDSVRLKANARAYFEPQPVKIGGFKLFFGSMLLDDVTTEDHQDEIKTTSFGAIGRYLKQNQLLKLGVVMEQDGKTREI